MEKERQRQKKILDWEWNQILLRRKYADTPAGFSGREDEEEACRRWEKQWNQWNLYHEYALLGSYEPEKEAFAGRAKEFAEISRAIREKQGPVILYGIGGIGKSALARAWTRTHCKEYDGVRILRYQTSILETVVDDTQLTISNLMYSISGYNNKRRYFHRKIQKLREIAEKEKLLLVLDGCDTFYDRDLERVFALPCDFLVTTRIQPSVWKREGIRIGPLHKEEEWNEFVRCLGRPLEPEQEMIVKDVRKKMLGHTLWMKNRITGKAEDEIVNIRFAEGLFGHPLLNKREKQVLCYLSILPEEGISSGLFYEVTQSSDKAVWRLWNCSLIRKKQNAESQEILQIHPVAAAAVRKIFPPTTVNCSGLIHGFSQYLHNRTWDQTWEENQKLEVLIRAVIKAFPNPAAWLAAEFDELATYLWIQGYFKDAEEYALRIMRNTRTYYGENHQVTGQIALRVAAVYESALHFERANAWYQRSLEILQDSRAENRKYYLHLMTAYCKNARAKRHEGMLREAEALLDQAEASLRNYRSSSRTLETFSASRQYLLLERAKIYLQEDRYKEAEKLYGESIRATREEYGEIGFLQEEFSGVQMKLLCAKGKVREAEELCRRRTQETAQYRGETFKDTLSCREQWGDVLIRLGESRQAIQQYGIVSDTLSVHYPHQVKWLARVDKKIEGIHGRRG